MRVFTCPNKLAIEISGPLVGIDGVDGAGKSYLAKKLSEKTGLGLVPLEDHLKKGQGTFVDNLRLGNIEGAIAGNSGSCILEGVCLMHVLALLNRKVDQLVYVKRISKQGFWPDERECSIYPENLPAFFRQEERNAAMMAEYLGETVESDTNLVSPFRREIVRYHSLYRPQEFADFEYHRVEA